MNNEKIIRNENVTNDTQAELLRKEITQALERNNNDFTSAEVIAASERYNEYTMNR